MDTNPFGIKKSPLLEQFQNLIRTKKKALDIGCAHGSKSIYLANFGLDVTAIDKKMPTDFTDKRIHKKETDICTFLFEKYDIILALNILQFLTKKEQHNVLKKIVKSLKSGGLLFITSFTQKDPSYSNSKHIVGHFSENELIDWANYNGLTILHYKEHIIDDYHEPVGAHQHGLVELVAQK